MSLLGKKKNTSEDGQMELIEHLAELRNRLFRMIFYLIGGMIATYWLFHPIYNALNYPLQRALGEAGVLGNMTLPSIEKAFLLRLQFAFIAGLTLTFPMIVLELWGFVRPALTDKEREPVRFLAPFSVLLFFSGVGTGYAALPIAFHWMAGYISDMQGAQLLQNVTDYFLLTVKILLAFGIAFELPVVLLFLARIGVLSAKIMTTYWRHGVVIIATLAAIFVPSNDPLTMLMMAVPMAGLYLLSISLVRAFEPREDGTESKPLATMILVSLAPAALLIALSWWIWRSTKQPIKKPGDNRPTMATSLSPELEKRVKTLEQLAEQQMETIKTQEQTIKQLQEVVVKLATPTATPTPEPTPGPTNTAPTLPEDGR